MLIWRSLALWSIALAALAYGAVATAQGPAPCSDPEYRQFDFWVGNWRVTTPDGKLAGENQIAIAQNGCVLTESYSTPAGYSGQSVNIYDRVTGRWHQTWVDVGGLLLQLDGGLVGGSMQLSGPGKLPDGTAVTHRITWTPNDDGSVRQHWQSRATDDGAWQTLFDGLYSRIESP